MAENSWLLFLVGCALACHPAAATKSGVEPTPLTLRFASTMPAPTPADPLQGCQSEDAAGLRNLLGLLPPWDKERPQVMLELGFSLEKSPDAVCLHAADTLFGELATGYPNRPEAARATLEVGLVALYLKEPATTLEHLLKAYPERGPRLLEAAKTGGTKAALSFLQAYGNDQTSDLIVAYTAWLHQGATDKNTGPELQKPQ